MDHSTTRSPGACEEYVDLLARSVDGVLTETERVRLDAHVASCAACRQALADQRLIRTSLSEALSLDASPAFVGRVLSQLPESGRWFDRLDFRRLTWRLSPVAAGLALAAAFVVATGQPTVTDAAGPDSIPPAALSFDEVIESSDMVTLLWQAEGGQVEAGGNGEGEVIP